MEASFVSAEQRTSKAKTVAIVALAVVGTFAACFLLFNQAATTTSMDDRTAAYDSYAHWKSKNGLTYGGAEDKLRFENYYGNYEIVKAHYNKGLSYELTMTPFAAMTLSEFVATHLGVNPRPKRIGQVRLTKLDESSIPDAVNWTSKGVVTPVKNQGQCGSCWAFSTTGSLEGLHAIKNGQLLSFSEQDLVDCSQEYGNQGCNGGLMDNAFKYVKDNGIALEADYPYTGVDGTCKKNVKRVEKLIGGFQDVIADSSVQLKAAIVLGPVSVAIEADTSVFQLFSKGVITGSACGTQLDHGVLAVGFGVEDSLPYYLVKNSWGPSWGEAGYVKIGIVGGDGVCGIQKAASYPTL